MTNQLIMNDSWSWYILAKSTVLWITADDTIFVENQICLLLLNFFLQYRITVTSAPNSITYKVLILICKQIY